MSYLAALKRPKLNEKYVEYHKLSTNFTQVAGVSKRITYIHGF